jgi:hypothetical protein
MISRTILAAAMLFGVAVPALAQDPAPAGEPARMQHHAIMMDSAMTEKPVFADLPGEGKKCWIGDSLYFTYKFDKKPKLGTAFLKVQLFEKAGAQVTSLDVVGASDMPSMRGAHDSGNVAFKLNKKGDYLMPVNVVMPGEWEVLLTFLKGEEPLFRGRITFKV